LRVTSASGTDNVDAYNLYLMARQHYATGNEGDIRRNEAIVRLCKRAAEIDPDYAQAWALMALGQMLARLVKGGQVDDGLAAAERALQIDGNLAAAHAVKARILSESGRHDEAGREIEVALRLDPESYEVNRAAAYLRFRTAAGVRAAIARGELVPDGRGPHHVALFLPTTLDDYARRRAHAHDAGHEVPRRLPVAGRAVANDRPLHGPTHRPLQAARADVDARAGQDGGRGRSPAPVVAPRGSRRAEAAADAAQRLRSLMARAKGA
jgi:tetratricopeptide (TPR) repeat protein